MVQQLEENGLDKAAIESTRARYVRRKSKLDDSLSDWQDPDPAYYDLPYPSVRLVALPWGLINYNASCRFLTGMAWQITNEVTAALTPNASWYRLPPHKYHW